MFVGNSTSPVLDLADVGVALNSASDIATSEADVIMMKDRLDDVLNAILVSKSTLRTIRVNFFHVVELHCKGIK